MYEQDLKIKKYVNAVERRLRMPLNVRSRVMSDFGSSISARREAGESVEQILASLGTPKQAAAELNEQMKDYTYRKSPWRLAFLAAAVLGGLYLLSEILTMLIVYFITGSEAHTIGVIGGADGPTAVFVTSAIDSPTVEFVLAASVAALAIGAFGYWKLSHMKRK